MGIKTVTSYYGVSGQFITAKGESAVALTSRHCSLYYSAPMASTSPTDLMAGVLQVTDQYQSANNYFWISTVEEINTARDFYRGQGFGIKVSRVVSSMGLVSHR